MVHFVVHTTAVVILAAYSAALISFLTVNTFIMPFTTMEGLLKDGNYRFSVIGDSADFSFFQVFKLSSSNLYIRLLLFSFFNLFLTDISRSFKESDSRLSFNSFSKEWSKDHIYEKLHVCDVCVVMMLFSLRQNTSDKTMKMLNEKVLMKETDLPRNYLEGLERVCKEDKYAFMVLDNMAAILQQKVNCKLEPLDVITQTTIAMALRPNSPYRGIIDTK